MNTKTAALLVGIIFLLVGILGYFPNPIIGRSDDAIFHADTTHNMVHVISGVLFLIVAMASPSSAGMFLKVFGIIYLVLGVYGLLTIGDSGTTELLGFLPVNGADNYLHIALGILIFLLGFLPGRRVIA